MSGENGSGLPEDSVAALSGKEKMSAEADRRGLTRVGFHIRAVVEHRQGTFNASVNDLSLHGMGIAGGEPLPVGEPVEVTIALLEASPDFTVRVAGKVVRADPAGVGIAFERIEVDSFALLRKIIAYNTGDPDRVMAEFCEFIQNRRGADE